MYQKAEFGPQLPRLLACFVHDTYSWGEMTLFQFCDILESLHTSSEHELGGCKAEKNELKDSVLPGMILYKRHQTWECQMPV